MKFIVRIFMPVCFLILNSKAGAEIAVRHVTTSEIEFQALAQALGYSTIAEILIEKSYVANDMLELFNLRLGEAQNEWLKRKPETRLTPALDRFLDLSLEADWSSSERATFVKFMLRKISLDATFEHQGFARIAAFGGTEIDFSEMPDLNEKWRKYQMTQTEPAAALLAKLPTDVVAILVNGRVLSRQEFASFSFLKGAARVTLISNTYQPMTIRLKGDETEWPAFSRTPWIADDCRRNEWYSQIESRNALELKPLGYARCAEKVAASEMPQKKLDNVTVKFGIPRPPDEPLQLPASNDRPLLRNPWFWGAVGVLAIGAAVAVRSEKEAIRPTVNESW